MRRGRLLFGNLPGDSGFRPFLQVFLVMWVSCLAFYGVVAMCGLVDAPYWKAMPITAAMAALVAGAAAGLLYRVSRPWGTLGAGAVSQDCAEAFAQVSTDLFVILDMDGRVVMMNRAMHESLGCAEDESQGRDFVDDFVCEADRPRASLCIQEASEPGGESYFEARTMAGSGSEMQVIWHAKDLNGKVVLAGIDITEHKKTQEALASSERRYRLYAENMRDVLWVLDTNLRYVYVSPSVYQLRGYTPEETMAMPMDRVFTQGSFRRLLKITEEVKSILASGERIDPRRSISMELEQVCRDGTTKWIEIIANLLLDDDGSHVGFLGITRDISDRRLAQESLRLSEERYRSIFETTGNATAIIRGDSVISLANSEFERLSGYTKEEIEARMQWSDFVEEADRERIMDDHRAWRTQPSEAPRNYDFRFRDRSGGVHFVIASATRLPGTTMSVVSLLDITDRIQAEERLKASREQLRNLHMHTQELRERERANVAREIHDELGQVLTALKMDLSFFARRLKPDQEALQSKVASMSRSIDTSIDSVRKIIMELRPGLLDHLGLVPAIEWLVGEFQARTGITCTLSVSSPEVALESEVSTTVFRILQEALTNVARHAGATEVRVSLFNGVDTLTLTIHDNGRGITKNQIDDPKSFGLMGMKERALFCNGVFDVYADAQNGGTVVIMHIPVSETVKGHDKSTGSG